MTAASVARVVAALAACLATASCATQSSNSNSRQDQPFAGPGSQDGPPAPQQMDAMRALGLWRSTFGAVKIEPDNSRGGLDAGNVQGIWVYERQGQEVIGYFAGNLRGNVLQFRWQEPNDPPLTGEGFLVFDSQGRQYSGRWWSDKRDRVGDWSGWRQSAHAARPGAQPYLDQQSSPYGGQSDGDSDAASNPYRRAQPYQPYRPRQAPTQQPATAQQPVYY
jgi:hypothetical protein